MVICVINHLKGIVQDAFSFVGSGLQNHLKDQLYHLKQISGVISHPFGFLGDKREALLQLRESSFVVAECIQTLGHDEVIIEDLFYEFVVGGVIEGEDRVGGFC